MGFKKYAISEKIENIGLEAKVRVDNLLTRLGKTSAADLTDEEREELRKTMDNGTN
jgi:hypothetical protein